MFGLSGLVLWSWVLTDPNFTLVKHADWTVFREVMVSIGYHDRILSSQIFVVLVAIITLSYVAIQVRPPRVTVGTVLFVGIVAGLLSYPALSHDLFNYIFDARIFTHYGENPYLHKALDFPADPMVRFMHWTHRTYPYGPTFLLLTLVPSFLGFGKFAFTFFLFKLTNVLLYFVATYCLHETNKRSALVFALSPLVIVEGLINSHNDFIALSFAIIGYYLVSKKNLVWGLTSLLFGGFVKYMTLPTVLLAFGIHHKREVNLLGRKVGLETLKNMIVGALVAVLVLYVVANGEIHPWYFLNLFVMIPFFPSIFVLLTPFFTGLLLGYYPYVLGGEWGQGGDVKFKNLIIYVSIAVTIVFLIICYIFKQFLGRKKTKIQKKK